MAVAEKAKKAKDHILENKKTYLIGAGCLGAGVLLGRNGAQVKNIVDAYKLQLWSPTTNIVTTALERRGHPGYIVKNLATGELFASQNRAAAACGVSPGRLSSHLNGLLEHAGGQRFERIGEAF